MTRSFHFVVARPWGGVLIGVAACWPAWAQQTLERVEITGSSVRRIDAESALPVQIIRREAIERSGYTSTVDLVRNLPAVMAARQLRGGGGCSLRGLAGHQSDEGGAAPVGAAFGNVFLVFHQLFDFPAGKGFAQDVLGCVQVVL